MVLTYEESGILEEKNYKRRMQWSIKSGEAWVRLLCYKKENIGDPTLSLSLRWWSRLSEADPTHHRSRSQITSYISVINSIFNLESMTDPWKNLLWRQKCFFFFFIYTVCCQKRHQIYTMAISQHIHTSETDFRWKANMAVTKFYTEFIIPYNYKNLVINIRSK